MSARREPGGAYQFVRVEVAAQGATLFVVLTDAESAPPPLALHNYSPVSIMFHQVTYRYSIDLHLHLSPYRFTFTLTTVCQLCVLC